MVTGRSFETIDASLVERRHTAYPLESARTPGTLSEAIQYYSDPDVATRALAYARWGDRAECLHCHSQLNHFYLSTRRIWKCRNCHKQFSPKVGTIFENSPVGLDRWLIAVWLVANSEERVSSYKLYRLIGVTEPTAVFMLRRIRLAAYARICEIETRVTQT